MTAAGETLAVPAPRLDGADWPAAADALIAVVTNRLHSDVSRRGYRTALRQFLAWHVAQGRGPLSRALVQRYRVVLEGRKLAPSTINQRLSAICALATSAPRAACSISDDAERTRAWLVRDSCQV